MSVESNKENSNIRAILPEVGHDLLLISDVLQKDSNSPESSYTNQPTQKVVQKRDDGLWGAVKTPFRSSHIRIHQGVQIADIYEVHDALEVYVSDLIKNPRPDYKTITYGYASEEAQTARLIARNKANFANVPQHLHFLDIDSIIAPAYLRGRSLQSLAWWLYRDVLPKWLKDCTFIIQATGSHGCIAKCGSRDVPRLRLFFWFEKKLTIQEFKSVVEAINADMKAREVEYIGKNPLDLSIYVPGHMLFFLPPIPTEDGVPFEHNRIEIFEGAYNEARLPDGLLEEHSSNVISLNSGGEYSPSQYKGVDLEGLLEAIESDGSHAPILAITGLFAREYPDKTDRDAALDELLPDLQSRLEDISKDEASYERRLREEVGENGEKLKKSADDYFAKFNRAPQVVEVQQEVIENPYTIEQFREKFPDHFVERVRYLLKTYFRGYPASFGTPPFYEYKVPPGAGKSYAALRALVSLDILKNERLMYLNATHEQSEERCDEAFSFLTEEDAFDEDGIPRLRVFKGRRHLCLVTGEPVDEQARRLEETGISPISACETCDRYNECPWIAQREDKANGLIFAQHANIPTTLANIEIEQDDAPSLIVIDESWWQVLLDAKPSSFPVKELRIDIVSEEADVSPAVKLERDRLRHYRELLCNVLDGSVELVSIEAIGDFANSWFDTKRHIDRAIDYETSHSKELTKNIEALQKKISKKQSKAVKNELDALLSEYRVSVFVLKLYRALLVSIEIKDRTHVIGVQIAEDRGIKHVTCNIRKPLPEIMRRTPTISLNASANKQITEAIMGKRKHRLGFHDCDIHIPPDQYKITQIADRPFGKAMFLNGDTDNPYSHSNIMRLRLDIWLQAFKWKGRREHGCFIEDRKVDVLVICQKRVAELLRKLGIPDNVEVRHFPVEGLNGFKEVPCLFVLGRRSPPTEALELQAEALNYDNSDFQGVTTSDKYSYDRHQIKLVDGRICEISGERHPDPFCEVIRQSIADEGVKQAVHRARLFDRAAENFCEIYLYGTADTGLPVHKVTSWKEEGVSLYDLSVAKGLIFSSRETSMRVYGEAFGNPKSSKFSEHCKSVKKLLKEKMPKSFQLSNNKYIIGSRNNNTIFRPVKFRLAKSDSKRKAKIEDAYIDVSRYGKTDAAIKKLIETVVNEHRSSGEPVLHCVDFEWADVKKPKRKRGRPKKDKK